MILLTVLSGCASNKEINAVTKGYDFTIKTKWNKQDVICDVVSDNNDYIFTVQQPERLKDMTVKYSGNSFKVSYLGMEYNCDNFSQDTHGVIEIVSEVLQKNHGTVVLDGKTEGTVNGIKYLLQVDDKGIPQELICSEIDLNIDFIKK